MATYNLGKFMMQVKGAYSSTATYGKLDVVYYGGSSYVCKSDNVTNQLPTNTAYWQQLAASGVATMTEEQKQEIIASLLASGVIIDSDYNTFTDEEKAKLAGLNNPNNGSLTIKRNNVTIGSFNADQSGDSTININVPTDYVSTPRKVTISDPNVDIEKLASNAVYILDNCESLSVNGYDYEGSAPDSFAETSHLPTYLYVYAKAEFDAVLPPSTSNVSTFVATGQLQMEQDKLYRMTARAGVWEIVELQAI